jgi:hypothetical protein
LIAPDLIQRLITEQQEVCKGFIASLDEQLAEEMDAFRRLVLEMRLAQNRALLGWLQRAQSEVAV